MELRKVMSPSLAPSLIGLRRVVTDTLPSPLDITSSPSLLDTQATLGRRRDTVASL